MRIMTIGSAALKAALPNSFVLPDLRHVGVYNLGGALGRDALTALNLQMSKLDEVLMRELESLCAPWVVLREQRHGDVIEVMSGWAHAAHSLHACWNMAFYHLKITTVLEIAYMQRMRGAQLIGQRPAEDYAAALHICVDELNDILGQHAK